MPKSNCHQIGNTEKSKTFTRKLKITDFVFNYKKEDFVQATLDYYFDNASFVEYKNGKKLKEKTLPLISFSLNAEDINKKIYSFEFIIKMSLKKLEALKDGVKNINSNIITNEIYFNNPYEKNQGPLFCSFKNDINNNMPNFWLYKTKNKCEFKVSYPEECVFLWFSFDLEKKDD